MNILLSLRTESFDSEEWIIYESFITTSLMNMPRKTRANIKILKLDLFGLNLTFYESLLNFTFLISKDLEYSTQVNELLLLLFLWYFLVISGHWQQIMLKRAVEIIFMHSHFMFHERKKVKQVWNDIKMTSIELFL